MLAWSVLLHFIGDYITQSHWMATQKVNRWIPAIAHGVTYTLPFLLLTTSLPALAVICGTHIIIDKYRLAKHFIWIKNHLAPRSYAQPQWADAKENGGYAKDVPPFMAIWLMIIVDNIIHILINFGALTWLS
jgi:hypothetical protein